MKSQLRKLISLSNIVIIKDGDQNRKHKKIKWLEYGCLIHFDFPHAYRAAMKRILYSVLSVHLQFYLAIICKSFELDDLQCRIFSKLTEEASLEHTDDMLVSQSKMKWRNSMWLILAPVQT